MTVLGLAVAGAWVVAVLCLLLTLALVRRVNMLAAQVAVQVSASADSLGLNNGEPLPDFEALDLEGRTRSSRELIGERPALIAIMSSTCPSCRGQVGDFNSVSRRAARTGWASVAVVSGDEETAADLIAAIGADTHILLSPGQDAQLLRDLRISYSPTYYAIGEDGRVMLREFSARALQKAVDVVQAG